MNISTFSVDLVQLISQLAKRRHQVTQLFNSSLTQTVVHIVSFDSILQTNLTTIGPYSFLFSFHKSVHHNHESGSSDPLVREVDNFDRSRT